MKSPCVFGIRFRKVSPDGANRDCCCITKKIGIRRVDKYKRGYHDQIARAFCTAAHRSRANAVTETGITQSWGITRVNRQAGQDGAAPLFVDQGLPLILLKCPDSLCTEHSLMNPFFEAAQPQYCATPTQTHLSITESLLMFRKTATKHSSREALGLGE